MKDKLTAVLLSVLLFLSLAGCGEIEPLSQPTWEDRYEQGTRCLAGGDLKGAVSALKAAVELDDKRPEGYSALADAHIAAGDEMSALSVLRRGYYATGDEGLKARLDGMSDLRSTPVPAPAPEPEDTPAPSDPAAPPPSASVSPAPDADPSDVTLPGPKYVTGWECTAANETVVYTGSWRDGMPNGQGTAVFPDGGTYEGGWQDGQPYGHGVREKKDTGSVVEGEFSGNGWAGQVTIVYQSGASYTGDTDVRGLKHGRGTYTWPDGTVYDGEWADDRRGGHGVLTWSTGYRYDGAWKDDKESGYGVMTFPDGGRYEGEWENDGYNGLGTLYGPDGNKTADGTWKDNQLVSGTRYGSDGSVIEYVN